MKEILLAGCSVASLIIAIFALNRTNYWNGYLKGLEDAVDTFEEMIRKKQ